MPDNRAPKNIRLAETTIAEASPGATVGRLRVRDPDAGDTFTYTVDDDRFIVTATGRLKLKVGEALDHETADQVVVTVTATDAGGLSVTKAFTLDVLDGQPALDAVALDSPLLDDRLVFSVLGSTDGRQDNRATTLRLVNRGDDTLNLGNITLSGPFVFVDPTPAALEPGAFLNLVVAFDPAGYDAATDPDIFTGKLRIVSDDPSKPTLVVDLAGFWQREPERGQEPTINEIWEVFGYANRVDDLSALDNFDLVEALEGPREVLSPYWQLAEGVTAATVTWLASFHGFNAVAGIAIHAPGAAAQAIALLTQTENQNQTVLPATTTGTANATIEAALVPNGWDGDDVFGFFIQGGSSDPTLNLPGPGTPPDPDAPRGHFIRFFEALDEDGEVIPNTYLVIEDYNSRGVNYDYNDNVFVISGIVPATDFA